MDFIPYGRQNIDEEDIKEVVNTLRSDWLTTGPKVGEFEDALCGYTGSKNAVAVNSGTSALDIAVQALGISPGSEVITTPFTFVATSNSLLYNGLVPVFADIERRTRNIDPDGIRKKITSKTKAISYVDYAGHACEIDEIREIANEHDLLLIEDASHALGCEYKGKRVGGFADMTILSFHPVKLITTGEGGAVLTPSSDHYERLKMLRNHGIDKEAAKRHGSDAGYQYDINHLGRNYRITDFQCSLGMVQLKKLDSFIEKRTSLAARYYDKLKDIDLVETPITLPHVKHAWHIYTILLKDGVKRDEFFLYMRKNNIGVNVHYIPIYRFSYYQKRFALDRIDYPITEDVFNSIITLPLHPQMSTEDIDYICEKVRGYEG